MQSVNCKGCAIPLRVPDRRATQRRGVFCSMACRKRQATVNCAECGEQIHRKPHVQKKSKSGKLYCSKACSNKANAMTGALNPNYSGGPVKIACSVCGSEMIRAASQSKAESPVCSAACQSVLKSMRTGEKQWKWNGGPVSVKCDQCGADTPPRAKSQIAAYAKHFCGKICFAAWKSANIVLDAHPNWLGGKSFEPYPTTWTFKLREAIRNRDGRQCRVCGKPEIDNGARLTVHHIDYVKENLAPGNLASLCTTCHGRTNFNRPSWIAWFGAQILAAQELTA